MPIDKQIAYAIATINLIPQDKFGRKLFYPEDVRQLEYIFDFVEQFLALSKQDGVPREIKEGDIFYKNEVIRETYNQARKDMLLYFLGKAEVERIKKILLKDTKPCPNKDCKGGYVRLWIGTPDEGNTFCEICNGKGSLEFTVEDKAQAISTSILGGKE